MRKSFFGIVDLLSVLPTYIAMVSSADAHYLMIVRILRLMRIFRILKLARFLHEAETLKRALQLSLPKITVFAAAIVAIVVIVGALMYVVEGEEHGFSNIPISIYWAIVTLTTVGYGDMSPKTPLGQFLSCIVMMLGYAIIAVPTGIVSVQFAPPPLRYWLAKKVRRKNRTSAILSSAVSADTTWFLRKVGHARSRQDGLIGNRIEHVYQTL